MPDRSFLDWPFFEAHHRQRAGSLEEWAVSSLRQVDHHDIENACRKLVADMGEAGWLQATASADGSPLDVRTLCLSRETLARHDGLADFAFAMQGLGTGAISLFGNDEQRQTWLPLTRSGKAIAAFALTEPQSGSDVANATMTATRDGDAWTITSEATSLSSCDVCEPLVATCSLGVPADGSHTVAHGGDRLVLEVPGELDPSCMGAPVAGEPL